MRGAQKHPSDPKPSDLISPLPCTLPSSDLISFPKNLVQLGIDNYKTLRERRRMIHCKHTLSSLFSGEQPAIKEWRLTPAAARQAGAFTTEMEIVIGFLRALEPFRVLSVDDQLILTKSFSKKFRIMETYYNTYRNGGHRTNRLYRMDYTYLDLAPGKEDERRLSEESLTAAEDEWPAGWGPSCSAFQIGDATMSNMWHAKFREGLKHIAAQMESIGMGDAEFASLALMTVFDPTLNGLSEIAKTVLTLARNRLHHDWLAYYKERGVGDGGERMGSSILLVSELNDATRDFQEYFQLVRIFGTYEYDKVLDDDSYYCVSAN